MAKFTVRVELHDAEWDDYEALHSAMKNEGFLRTVTGDNGVKYQLPWAEYNRVGTVSSDEVLQNAQNAADTTGRSHSILVTESSGRKWSGLDVIKN